MIPTSWSALKAAAVRFATFFVAALVLVLTTTHVSTLKDLGAAALAAVVAAVEKFFTQTQALNAAKAK